jgi:hypothetical protein
MDEATMGNEPVRAKGLEYALKLGEIIAVAPVRASLVRRRGIVFAHDLGGPSLSTDALLRKPGHMEIPNGSRFVRWMTFWEDSLRPQAKCEELGREEI